MILNWYCYALITSAAVSDFTIISQLCKIQSSSHYNLKLDIYLQLETVTSA